MTSVRSITLTPELLLEVPRLRRAQVVVEDDEVGLVRLDQLLELLDLARADIGGDVDLLPLLQHAADDDQAGRLGQPADLVQRVVGRDIAVGQDNPDQDGSFLTSERSVRFVFDQRGIRPRFMIDEMDRELFVPGAQFQGPGHPPPTRSTNNGQTRRHPRSKPLRIREVRRYGLDDESPPYLPRVIRRPYAAGSILRSGPTPPARQASLGNRAAPAAPTEVRDPKSPVASLRPVWSRRT